MSAVVCGKRSFFEDIESAASSPTSVSPQVYKKFRCPSTTSPVQFFFSPLVHPTLVDQLKALFPEMETQLLEKTLENSGNDLESAIRNIHELRLTYAECHSSSEEIANAEKRSTPTGEDAFPMKEPQVQKNLPVDGAEWVDLFVREMMSATSIDNARARAASILESLEKSIRSQASMEAAQGFHKENVMLKEQIDVLFRDNMILKCAIAIQHECQKEYDERNSEVQELKQLVAHYYQEQLRTLQMNNYALTLRLQQAQLRNSIPGRFHPDVL